MLLIVQQEIFLIFLIQKPYLRTQYLGSDIEENSDMKNQVVIKNLPDPLSLPEAASK